MENATTSLAKEIADTAIVLPKLQARTAGTTPLQARHRWIEEDMYSKGMESCVSEGREGGVLLDHLHEVKRGYRYRQTANGIGRVLPHYKI